MLQVRQHTNAFASIRCNGNIPATAKAENINEGEVGFNNDNMKNFKFLLILFLFGCQTQNIPDTDKKSEQTIKGTLKIDTLSKLNFTVSEENKKDTNQVAFSCMNMLIKLIKKSNYKSEYKKLNFKLYIDNFEDSVVTLGLTIKNEERNDDVALGWIEFDLRKKMLSDVTIDPNRPIILKTDTIILNQILNNCKFQDVTYH